MIAHSVKFVGNPEEVGCTLQNEVVLLKSRDRLIPCKHSHQVMAQVEDTLQGGCFGDLSNFTCGIKLNRTSGYSLCNGIDA